MQGMQTFNNYLNINFNTNSVFAGTPIFTTSKLNWTNNIRQVFAWHKIFFCFPEDSTVFLHIIYKTSKDTHASGFFGLFFLISINRYGLVSGCNFGIYRLNTLPGAKPGVKTLKAVQN